MIDAIIPRRRLYVLATDEQTNEQTNISLDIAIA